MATTQLSTSAVIRCRFSYLHVFTPSARDGEEPKFSAVGLIPKTDEKTINLIKAAMWNAFEQGKKTHGLTDAMRQAPRFWPLRDGDKDRADKPEFAGCIFLNTKSRNRPQVVDVNRQPILDEHDIYSGCYGYLSVNFYPFNKNGNRGIAVGLNNIMKVKDGDYLGGRSSAAADFAGMDFAADFGITETPVSGPAMQPITTPQQLQQRYQPQGAAPQQTEQAQTPQAVPLPWEDLPF
jgi:hypothetical protein